MDILIPVQDNGRDVLTCDDPLNQVRYLVKSIEFSTSPPVLTMRIKKKLKKHGYDAEVVVDGNKITVIIGTDILTIEGGVIT